MPWYDFLTGGFGKPFHEQGEHTPYANSPPATDAATPAPAAESGHIGYQSAPAAAPAGSTSSPIVEHLTGPTGGGGAGGGAGLDVGPMIEAQEAAGQAQANLSGAEAEQKRQTAEKLLPEMQWRNFDARNADIDYQRHIQNMDDMDREHQARREAVFSQQVDPSHYWHDMGAAGQVSSLIGLMLGGFVQPTTGHNPAMEFIDRSIQQDIDAQKSNIERGIRGYEQEGTDLERQYKRFGDAHQAEMAAALDGYNNVAAEIEMQAQAAPDNPVVQAQKDAILADVHAKAMTLATQMGAKIGAGKYGRSVKGLGGEPTAGPATQSAQPQPTPTTEGLTDLPGFVAKGAPGASPERKDSELWQQADQEGVRSPAAKKLLQHALGGGPPPAAHPASQAPAAAAPPAAAPAQAPRAAAPAQAPAGSADESNRLTSEAIARLPPKISMKLAPNQVIRPDGVIAFASTPDSAKRLQVISDNTKRVLTDAPQLVRLLQSDAIYDTTGEARKQAINIAKNLTVSDVGTADTRGAGGGGLGMLNVRSQAMGGIYEALSEVDKHINNPIAVADYKLKVYRMREAWIASIHEAMKTARSDAESAFNTSSLGVPRSDGNLHQAPPLSMGGGASTGFTPGAEFRR